MTHIELPRALEDYFAFAEIDPTRHGRRFTISMPYFNGARLDRLQWWYHLSPAHEQQHGADILKVLKTRATQRFRQHIERWLENTGQRLYGAEPIPHIAPIAATNAARAESAEPIVTQISTASAPLPTPATAPPLEPTANETPTVLSDEPPAEEAQNNVLPWRTERVANG